ncbi:MAG: phospho-sugar mutase [Bacteroidales bacterium]|nr:phospho-sugar mutase [Bacteroidales bacterium]MBN2762504.1 phospho-sugar mutase [Bacteroidales bacterium]
MNTGDLLREVKSKAQAWLEGNYDAETKKQIRKLLDSNEKELIESFYRDLEFGTGGLRGIMGAGTNRMNIYTVGMATQGLSNHLKKQFSDVSQIKVAVAHDSRNNSRLFAETSANIFSANGFKVYLFDDVRPTPELSFAIRYFRCQSGIVITASHNPKEYNGYKAYWDDGGQIIAPHDKLIIKEVQKIKSISEVSFDAKPENIEIIGKEFDDIYTDQITTLSLSPEVIKRQSELKIVFTPIHGTGGRLVPLALKKFGFKNVINVPEQDEPDGNFPTVHSPNPEEQAALSMAIKKATETDADIVMATDPDADRVGVAVRDYRGEFIILNGNQTAALLIYYLLSKWSEKKKLTGKEYIVKTIVTTELLACIATHFKVDCFDVLTGFKYIADVIKHFEGRKTFIGGGEESYGYLAGDFVRDKDAIISCALIAETAAWSKDQGKSMFAMLLEIYKEFGFFKEKLISLVRKGKTGQEEIQQMMKDFRTKPPVTINNAKVTEVIDYLSDDSIRRVNEKNKGIKIPKADVLQLMTEDGSKISIRPSGTEPKIKFYFGVKEELNDLSEYERVNKLLDAKIEDIIRDLKIK